MSETRAKINLGDIQCECLKRSMDCEKGGIVCDYRPICHALKNEMPLVWDLRDPPRFDEAQMAFWKSWYAMGARKVISLHQTEGLMMFTNEYADSMGTARLSIGLKINETLDLAELLGKDGTG